MLITTDKAEKFNDEITKYYSNKERYDQMKKAVKLTSLLSFIGLACFYGFFFCYIFTRLAKLDSTFVFKFMMFFLITGIIMTITTLFLQTKRFEMSTRAKIINFAKINKDNGYEPADIKLWFDMDKIYAHLIFKNKKGEETLSFMRLDEFIVIYEDISQPEIRLDTFQIVLPKEREKQNIITCEK